MSEALTSKFHANLISTIADFIVGDTSYWKLKYRETIEELNESINNAKDELEYCSECSIENTHWLSFHYAFLDVIKYHFEFVKCKQINSYRILKVMKKDFAKFYYGGNEYKTFQEYKEKIYDFHCRKFIHWERSSLRGKIDLVWEDPFLS